MRLTFECSFFFQEMSEFLDPEAEGTINLSAFLSMMDKKLEDTDQDVLEAFRVFDLV